MQRAWWAVTALQLVDPLFLPSPGAVVRRFDLWLHDGGLLSDAGISIFRVIFASTIAVSGATASLIFLFLFHPAIGVLNYMLDLAQLPRVQWLTSEGSALISVSLVTIWVEPKRVAEVRFAEWTEDDLLRQPACLGLREDKPARKVVRET